MMLCDWCGKSLTLYNHDGCADGYGDVEWGDIIDTDTSDDPSDQDPWAALINRMRGESDA